MSSNLKELAINLTTEERMRHPEYEKLERIHKQYFMEDITEEEGLKYIKDHPDNILEVDTILQKYNSSREFMSHYIDIMKEKHKLYFMDERLCDDKELMLKSISYNSLNLYHASERLKKDKEIVLTVLENDKRVTIRDLEDYYKKFGTDKEIMDKVYENFLNDPCVSEEERKAGIIRFHIPVHKTEQGLDSICYSIFGDKAYISERPIFEMDGKKPIQISENIKYGRKSDLRLKTTKALKKVKEVIITEALQPANMSEWFYGMEKLKTITGLELLDTSNVKVMDELFHGCKSLEELVLNFDTSNLESMWAFTAECENLKTMTLNFTNTDKLQNIGGLCYGCKNLEILILNNFNIENVNYTLEIFDECPKLNPNNLSNKELLQELVAMN